MKCVASPWMLPLPAGAQRDIADFARPGPTPSAVALVAHLESCPWIWDVARAFPHVGLHTIIVQAKTLGLMPCWKCDSCSDAVLHRIRCEHDPEVAKFDWEIWEWD